MELSRQPFQGVLNIIRFNWHFYVIAVLILMLLIGCKKLFPENLQYLLVLGVMLAFATIIISLVVSYYVYDVSDLYELNWLKNLNHQKVLNINAGFDETSEILENKFVDIDLTICDFYDPEKHTEISIKRARQAYPPKDGTISVKTNQLPFLENSFDQTVAILSAHEIRDEEERVHFFGELSRVTKPSGKIYITEHFRDWKNFLAYTIGFLHFHSKPTWLKTFKMANLTLTKEIRTTPFVTTFILKKDGNTF